MVFNLYSQRVSLVKIFSAARSFQSVFHAIMCEEEMTSSKERGRQLKERR